MSRFVPRGVVVAGLAKRLISALVDFLPAIILVVTIPVAFTFSDSASLRLVVTIAASALTGVYGIAQWWAYGTRGAGLGARLTGVRIVGLEDGEPIGWWRYFLRQLVFFALLVTIVGGIAMLVFLVIQERRQGWHDIAAGSLVVEPLPEEKRSRETAARTSTSTVGLPPHLASSFAPATGTTQQRDPGWSAHPPTTQRPDWMPQLETEPLVASPQHPWQQAPGASQGPPQPQPTAPVEPDQLLRPASQPSAPPVSQASPPAPQQPPSARAANQGWIPLPTPTSIIQPRVRERDFGAGQDDVEGTRIAAPIGGADRPGDQGWYLRLDDGREVELGVPVLLGRNPQKTQGDPELQLVPAGGDGRMISRTHVMIGVDPRGVYVVDRGSTNGTAVVSGAGELEPCPIGTQVRIRESQQVSYGNRWFTVLRRPAL